MIYEWPKITKNLIITTNKHTENCDFLYQQLRAICEQTSYETDQKILEEIFKSTNYEINSNNYMGMLLTKTLLIEEVTDGRYCGRFLHIYFHGEHLMNIIVTSEVVYPRGATKDKVGYKYVTKIYVEKIKKERNKWKINI